MKRLLAYLIVVLGLGLTFNVNAEADELSNTAWKLNDSANHILFLENTDSDLYASIFEARIARTRL